MADERAKNTHGIPAGLVPQWQPINTAPRDEGVELLLFCKPRFGTGGVQLGHYKHPSPENNYTRGWHSHEGRVLENPTYWQPLPEQPEKEDVSVPKRIAIVSVEPMGDMTGPRFYVRAADLDTYSNAAGHKYVREDIVFQKQPIETAPAQTSLLVYERENGGWMVGRLSASGEWWSWGGSDRPGREGGSAWPMCASTPPTGICSRSRRHEPEQASAAGTWLRNGWRSAISRRTPPLLPSS